MPRIKAAQPENKLIRGFAEPVAIEAAQGEGESKGPPKFTSTFYTGGAMRISGWEHPVVIDLAGLTNGNVLVANLDHDSSKRVGNFSVTNDGKSLVANGAITAATDAAREVAESAANGYAWQSSLEVQPSQIEFVKAGKKVTVNGQELAGPLYHTRKGVLKGFGFVSHGADDNTTASIAAAAASTQEIEMEPKFKAWVEAMGFDADTLSAEQIAGLQANYEGRNAAKPKPVKATNAYDDIRAQSARKKDIVEAGTRWIAIHSKEDDDEFVSAVQKMADHAIDAGHDLQTFRNDLHESVLPVSYTVSAPRNRNGAVNEKVIEAALALAGRLQNIEKVFDEQTLDAADKQFKGGITLGQLYLTCAAANGYTGNRSKVDQDVQRAAFGVGGNRQMNAQGWSTISISNILANNQNKFFRDGWNSVDLSFLTLAAIRSVSDFREITTISLTGNLVFEKVGPAGEIKHGTLGDETTGNKVETYAKMLAITRQDIINDDLGALNVLPRKFGRGAALKLSEIFWTEFLNPTTANFYHTNNANVNTGVADMTVPGLAATETIFLAQVDPDGKPLNLEPKILVVPPGIRASALTLMSSERLIDGTATAAQGDANIYRGRFRVVVSPYLANSSYTGYDINGYYMMADPNDLPMIEIAALNGRVEPTIETADTDFNTLGTQFRAYSDVGVRVQHPEAVVRADGESS